VSEHYRRGDPETGCALMMIGFVIVIVLITLLVVLQPLVRAFVEALTP
jgi:hypothetical protein